MAPKRPSDDGPGIDVAMWVHAFDVIRTALHGLDADDGDEALQPQQQQQRRRRKEQPVMLVLAKLGQDAADRLCVPGVVPCIDAMVRACCHKRPDELKTRGDYIGARVVPGHAASTLVAAFEAAMWLGPSKQMASAMTRMYCACPTMRAEEARCKGGSALELVMRWGALLCTPLGLSPEHVPLHAPLAEHLCDLAVKQPHGSAPAPKRAATAKQLLAAAHALATPKPKPKPTPTEAPDATAPPPDPALEAVVQPLIKAALWLSPSAAAADIAELRLPLPPPTAARDALGLNAMDSLVLDLAAAMTSPRARIELFEGTAGQRTMPCPLTFRDHPLLQQLLQEAATGELDALGVRRGPAAGCDDRSEAYVISKGCAETFGWFFDGSGNVPSVEGLRWVRNVPRWPGMAALVLQRLVSDPDLTAADLELRVSAVAGWIAVTGWIGQRQIVADAIRDAVARTPSLQTAQAARGILAACEMHVAMLHVASAWPWVERPFRSVDQLHKAVNNCFGGARDLPLLRWVVRQAGDLLDTPE